jgi:hypothetical protein
MIRSSNGRFAPEADSHLAYREAIGRDTRWTRAASCRQKLRVRMRTAVRPMFNVTIREYNTKTDDFPPSLSKISSDPSSAFAAVTAV